MSTGRRTIQKGTTPLIVSYPKLRPEELAQLSQPTAATVAVNTPAEPSGAIGDAVIDELDATVSADAAEGDTSLALSSVNADIKKGRRYLLALPTGEKTVIRAAKDVDAVPVACTWTYSVPQLLEGLDLEGVFITLTDAADNTITYEFDVGGGGVSDPSFVSVAVAADDSAETCLNALMFAVLLNHGGFITSGAGATTGGGLTSITFSSTPVGPDAETEVLTNGNSLGFFKTVYADATMRLMSGLLADVPEDSTVQGFAVMRELTTNETEQVTEDVDATLEWTATIGGLELEWTEPFAIVRRVPVWVLDDDELVRRFPEVAALRERSDVMLEETREAALEEELLPRLRAKKDSTGTPIREENIVSTWPLVPAHVAAVRLFLANNDMANFTKQDRDEARAELQQKLDLAFADADAWYTAPQSARANPSDARAEVRKSSYRR